VLRPGGLATHLWRKADRMQISGKPRESPFSSGALVVLWRRDVSGFALRTEVQETVRKVKCVGASLVPGSLLGKTIEQYA